MANAATTTLLRSTASLVGITSTLMVLSFNTSTSHLFVPHMYKLDKQTSARIYDRLYHDGIKVVVPLAATAITSFSYLAYTSPSPAAPGSVLGTGSLGGKRPAFAREVGTKDMASAADVEALLRRWWWMNYVRGVGVLAAGALALAVTL